MIVMMIIHHFDVRIKEPFAHTDTDRGTQLPARTVAQRFLFCSKSCNCYTNCIDELYIHKIDV